MGYINKVIIISILILIVSIALHEYLPEQIVVLAKYPAIKTLTTITHKLLKDPLYFLNQESKPSIKPTQEFLKDQLFTADQLKSYNGKKGSKGLYLALLGHVYDVQKGDKHYGPGGGYEFFSGRDASRAFVSGDFTEAGLIDDISDLSSGDYLGLDDWVRFYNKDYTYVGKLIGRYYDGQGEPTPYNIETQKWISESYSHKEAESKEKLAFPPCNSEWSPEAGSKVYCTKKSGGVSRDWVGVPRKFFHPSYNSERCACVRNLGPPSHDPTRSPHLNRGDLDHPNLKEYPNCKPQEDSCHIPND